jgi:hypothetical protein
MSIASHRIVLGIAAAAGLSACSSSPGPHVPIPEDPGLYAVPALRAEADDEDDLKRLDGDKEWEVENWDERASLSPDTQFVIEDPSFSSDASSGQGLVELWKVAWVRSDLRSDGKAQPVQGSQWAVAPLDSFRVPLVFRPVMGRPDVIHAVPQERLAPGLYSLQLRKASGSRSARFGVDWPTANKQNYAAAHCVDRRSGGQPLYVACGTPETVVSPTPAQGLEISLVDPVARTVAGERILLIQGTITNGSNAPRSVPILEAALQDRSGAVLSRWTFAAEQSQLGPGQSATFRTEIRHPPAGTSRVNVSFSRNAATTAQ